MIDKKYLTESARITNAYLCMANTINENELQTVKRVVEKPEVSSVRKNNTVKQNDKKVLTNTVKKPLPIAKKPSSNIQKRPVVKKEEPKEIEYPENGDIEYTGEEEDYLMGKTNVRPKTLAPNARELFKKDMPKGTNESYDDGNYKFYVIIPCENCYKIESGWEFKEDAIDRGNELKNDFAESKDKIKIVGKNILSSKYNIDVVDDSCWVSGDISNCM